MRLIFGRRGADDREEVFRLELDTDLVAPDAVAAEVTTLRDVAVPWAAVPRVRLAERLKFEASDFEARSGALIA